MSVRQMLPEERDMAEALAKTFGTASEVQVTVHFETGYHGGVRVHLDWEGQLDALAFTWKTVAHLLTSSLTPDQQRIVGRYIEGEAG